jgi:hypothetical protein
VWQVEGLTDDDSHWTCPLLVQVMGEDGGDGAGTHSLGRVRTHLLQEWQVI